MHVYMHAYLVGKEMLLIQLSYTYVNMEIYIHPLCLVVSVTTGHASLAEQAQQENNSS